MQESRPADTPVEGKPIRPKKVGVFTFDFDDVLSNKTDAAGELRTEVFDTASPTDAVKITRDHERPVEKIKWKTALENDSKPLIDYIVTQIKKHNYTEVVICCSSSRQDFYTDMTTACKSLYTGSCYENLELFSELLKKRLQTEFPSDHLPVTLNRDLTADFFYQRADGNTFTRAVAWTTGESREDKGQLTELFQVSDPCPNDRTKISLSFRIIQRITAQQPPNTKIHFHILDDSYAQYIAEEKPAILPVLNNVFSNHSELIPEQASLTLAVCQHGVIQELLPITGSGIPAASPDEMMQQMMIESMSGNSFGERKANFENHYPCDVWELFKNPDKKELKKKLLSQLQKKNQDEEYSWGLASIWRGLVWLLQEFIGFFTKTPLPIEENLDKGNIARSWHSLFAQHFLKIHDPEKDSSIKLKNNMILMEPLNDSLAVAKALIFLNKQNASTNRRRQVIVDADKRNKNPSEIILYAVAIALIKIDEQDLQNFLPLFYAVITRTKIDELITVTKEICSAYALLKKADIPFSAAIVAAGRNAIAVAKRIMMEQSGISHLLEQEEQPTHLYLSLLSKDDPMPYIQAFSKLAANGITLNEEDSKPILQADSDACNAKADELIQANALRLSEAKNAPVVLVTASNQSTIEGTACEERLLSDAAHSTLFPPPSVPSVATQVRLRTISINNAMV